MEKKKKEMMMGVKMEDVVGSSSPFPSSSGYNNPFSSVFDFCEEADGKGSLGFMELLGSQDYYSTPLLLDSPQVCVAHDDNSDDLKGHPPKAAGKECSEVSNQPQPPTPNSSSVSSASSEAVHDEHNKTTVDQARDDEHQKTNKQLKAKKTNQKRQKQPRFAFMTKSEVDHLEDGYRWRKYGQKAVKNSPFPRSYYRCTSASCSVKKRVERSFNDSSVVVTTYEGQHTHPSPVMARSSGLAGPPVPPGVSAIATGFGSLMPENYLSQYYQRQHNQQHHLFNTLSSLGFPSSKISNASISQERQLCNPAGTNAFLRDHGLLQDVVPSHMLKEE